MFFHTTRTVSDSTTFATLKVNPSTGLLSGIGCSSPWIDGNLLEVVPVGEDRLEVGPLVPGLTY